MDLENKDEVQEEFTLEDILREFGSGTEPTVSNGETTEEAPVSDEEPAVPDEVTLEEPEMVDEVPPEEPGEPAEEPADVDQAEEATEEAVEEPEADTDPAATRRLDPISAVKTEPLEVTRPFTPIHSEKDAPEEPLPPIPEEEPEEKPEAFSEGWEPEYDDPIGEYTPPKPIEFPRSKLINMKRKIVAGPEKRFYELTELGLGKLQISIFLSFLVFFASVVSIILHEFDMVQDSRMRLLVFGEIFAMLLCALLGNNQLIEGVCSLFKGKFTLNTLLVCTFGVCIADAFVCLKELRVPYCAAFCLEMTMSLLASYQRRNTEMAQMDTLRRANVLYSVIRQENFYDDHPGFRKGEGDISDFMDRYQEPVRPESLLSLYSLFAFLISVVTAVTVAVMSGWNMAARVWSAILLAAVPATSFIAISRPMAVLERKLHRFGAVLCGWSGILFTEKAAAVAIEDQDLFPEGSIKLNGVKFFGDLDPDLVVSYGTSLVRKSGSPLAPLFESLQENRRVQEYEVERLQYYPNGGIGGEIEEESVLVGTLSFMQDMGVSMPEGTRVNQALYVAIDLNLCCVVALNFGKSRSASAGLSSLCGSFRLKPVLLSGNFMLDKKFIRSKFGVSPRKIIFPEMKVRSALANTPLPEGDQLKICALTTQEGLAPMAYAITGGRAMGHAARIGTALHIFGGLVGIGIVAVLVALRQYTLLSPVNLLLLELVWALPGFLITEWTRTI